MKQKPAIEIKGQPIDDATRCTHYHSDLDIIAIKFKCCTGYYPCYFCHAETVSHFPEKWKKEEFNTSAVMCGVCKNEMTINAYLNCNSVCPTCQSGFNPKCSNHYHLYFEI